MYAILKLFIFAIAIVLSLQVFATEVPSQSHKPAAPSFRDIRAMSQKELNAALSEYVGFEDTWKSNRSMIAKFQRYNPLKRKTTFQEEVKIVSQLSTSDHPQALQLSAIALTQSLHPELQNMVTVIQGEKRLVLNSYRYNRDHDLRYLLFFFRNLDFGYMGSENKKYLSEYAFGLRTLTTNLRATYEKSGKLGIPMILEFQSSALLKKSPLTLLLYNTIMRSSAHNPDQIIKAEITPNGGRIVSLSPAYGRVVVENIELFTQELEKTIKLQKGEAFSAKSEEIREESKNALVNLLRSGQGLSSIFYADEKLLEIEKAESAKPGICARFFGLFKK